MLKNDKGRRVCSSREAAQILGVSMARVRQMVLASEVWAERVTQRAIVLDRDEISRLAKMRAAARAAGRVGGPAPGGFSAG